MTGNQGITILFVALKSSTITSPIQFLDWQVQCVTGAGTSNDCSWVMRSASVGVRPCMALVDTEVIWEEA